MTSVNKIRLVYVIVNRCVRLLAAPRYYRRRLCLCGTVRSPPPRPHHVREDALRAADTS